MGSSTKAWLATRSGVPLAGPAPCRWNPVTGDVICMPSWARNYRVCTVSLSRRRAPAFVEDGGQKVTSLMELRWLKVLSAR